MIKFFKNLSIGNFIRNNNIEFTLAATIIVISILVQIRTQGRYLSSQNIYNLLREVSILAIVAVGQMMVIVSGGIDLSIGSTMGLAGIVSAMFLRDHSEISLVIIVLIAVGIGLLCGIINGLLVAKLKILPIIATLGTMGIYRGLAYVRSRGQWVAPGSMTEKFLSIATGHILGINNLVWIAILTYIFGYIFLNRMRLGRYIYAVGNSEESARITGINVDRIKIITYTISGIIAGLAGLLYICKFGFAQAESAEGYLILPIGACILGGVSIYGGVGKITGVLLGVLLWGVCDNLLPLTQVSQFWQQGIRGFVLVIAIIFNALTERNSERRAIQWKMRKE
jgi:rhamnose transport system permease protein